MRASGRGFELRTARELLPSLFGRHWARRSTKTLGRSAISMYRSSCRARPLIKYEIMQLLAQVPARRREIEKRWRRGVTVAEGLMFEWARENKSNISIARSSAS